MRPEAQMAIRGQTNMARTFAPREAKERGSLLSKDFTHDLSLGIRFLMVLFSAFASIEAMADDVVAESRRYQQAWSPSRIELVVADASINQLPSKEWQTVLASAAQEIAPTIRNAVTAYGAEFGLTIALTTGERPCPENEVTVRILITPQLGDAKEEESPGRRTLSIPMRVATSDGCGYRKDSFTRNVDINLQTQANAETGIDFRRQLDRLSRDVIDELVLVWHPVWNKWNGPDDGPVPFTNFALLPISPPPSRVSSFWSDLTGRSPHVLPPRMGVTTIETPSPQFRWEALETLLGRAKDNSLAPRVDRVRYEFRLFNVQSKAGYKLVPDGEMLRRDDLIEPHFDLPSPLEACQVYVWTVRARFRLDGFPRVTEWTGIHNGALGHVVPAWRLRRGEPIDWAEWRDILLSFPTFQTPSASGRGRCT